MPIEYSFRQNRQRCSETWGEYIIENYRIMKLELGAMNEFDEPVDQGLSISIGSLRMPLHE